MTDNQLVKVACSALNTTLHTQRTRHARQLAWITLSELPTANLRVQSSDSPDSVKVASAHDGLRWLPLAVPDRLPLR